jgi:potassium efflux system protein
MLKPLTTKIIASFIGLFLLTAGTFADTIPVENSLQQDKTRLITQQIDLLKNRVVQAHNELNKLQREDNEQSALLDRPSKQGLNQVGLDIAVAKSNRESINIELAESQQTIARLDKETQEIENQLNVYSIFGLKINRNEIPNLNGLKSELKYQKNLLELEKTRSEQLQALQDASTTILQSNKSRFERIEMSLKSQTMLQIKEKQAQSEIRFQQQQTYWLNQLNTLYAQLNAKSSNPSSPQYAQLEKQIFYANENVNFAYLQMLAVRYKDQLRQFKISIAHSTSITLLNKVSDQSQVLGKQLVQLNDLLKARMGILGKRKQVLIELKGNNADEIRSLTVLMEQYQKAMAYVDLLSQRLTVFRPQLEKALQHELSSRQGLPGFNTKAWLDLGAELMLVPSLTFQVLKSLTFNTMKAVHSVKAVWWMVGLGLELLFVGVVYLFSVFLQRVIAGVPDHEYGHINLKWLLIKLTRRNLVDMAVVLNAVLLFHFCGIATQNYIFLINIALVWLFYKGLLMAARLCLVESVHDRAGHDVLLYHRLKWSFIVGGVITALTVFIHQLPLIYEVKDLFDRMFLLFLLVVSVFLLKSWEVLPGLVLPHVDEKHTYVRRVVRLIGVLIPLILLLNSAIGLFGFVNFIQTISWYESVFLVVMIGYLFFRGLISDGMDLISQVFIRHVANGWLWTEAVLKPLDKIIRVVLFFTASAVLFSVYGWDKQSSVVRGLVALLNYHLVDALGTSITLLSLIELTLVVSFLFWGARWIREFVYRLLLSRTKDLGVRNSIAILSQYTFILIGIFVCLRVLGIDFRALTVVAGAFAFGVGLGLRDLVNNFACGFLLLLERPVRVGDTVTIGGYEGEVVNIGGRAVTVRTWDHMDVLVPNAEIFSKTFLNWTAKDHIIRTVISIKINRHDKPHDVQTIIYQVLAVHKDVLRDPVPEVFLKELNDGMTEFEVRYFVNLRLVKSRVAIRSEVLVDIWEAFEKHGIKPPYPHHEIFVKGDMANNPLLALTPE